MSSALQQDGAEPNVSVPAHPRSWTGDISHLTEEQLERLAAFRRSKLNQKSMMRIYETIAGHKPSPQMLIVLCGVAKLFVGDLTEEAVSIAAAQQEPTPVKVEHILAAYAYQKLQGSPGRLCDDRHKKRLRL